MLSLYSMHFSKFLWITDIRIVFKIICLTRNSDICWAASADGMTPGRRRNVKSYASERRHIYFLTLLDPQQCRIVHRGTYFNLTFSKKDQAKYHSRFISVIRGKRQHPSVELKPVMNGTLFGKCFWSLKAGYEWQFIRKSVCSRQSHIRWLPLAPNWPISAF